MEETKTIKEKTIELIDALKATCQTYGMGNDGNEYKIITQVFLYKFLNDKFGYEVKKVSPILRNAEKWELAYAEMSDADRLDIFDSLPSDIQIYLRRSHSVFQMLLQKKSLPTYQPKHGQKVLLLYHQLHTVSAFQKAVF